MRSIREWLGRSRPETRETAGAPAADLPLSYARTLSWLSLVIILLTSLGLSFFISNSARQTLLTKQEEFARLLADNLNHQIFRRFALPTILAHGRIALRQPSQYEHLNEVVGSVIHGLPVERLRIYDFSRLVAFSTNKEDLGRTGLAPEGLEEVLRGGPAQVEIISAIPDWQAPFNIPLQRGTFVLRLLCPLRGEALEAGGDPPLMGALELTQDITGDYEQVLAFQGIIVVMCLLSSVILFALLLMLIHRAERVLAERMNRNRQLENELHSNEKLASMGRVIASIAHEIRNPLGIIRSSAELLQRRTDKTDAGTRRILDAIYDESVRLSQTVNDFLDYARPRQPRQDLVDVNLVLDQALAFLEGVNDVNAAMALKGKTVFIDRTGVELPDGRHFIADLMGLEVIDADTGEKLGVVADVLTPPAHEVYVVKGEHEYMIPAVDEFLVETSVEGGYLKVRLIEGMRTDV